VVRRVIHGFGSGSAVQVWLIPVVLGGFSRIFDRHSYGHGLENHRFRQDLDLDIALMLPILSNLASVKRMSSV